MDSATMAAVTSVLAGGTDEEEIVALVAAFLQERLRRKRRRQLLMQLILQACLEDKESMQPTEQHATDETPEEERKEPSASSPLLKIYLNTADSFGFEKCFGVSPSTAEEVACIVGNAWAEIEHSKVLRSLGVQKQVAVALHYMATGQPIIPRNFGGLRRMHVLLCVRRVFGTVCNVKHSEVIKWPEAHQLENIAKGYEEISGLPGVVGTIGACSVAVLLTKGNRREVETAVVLQGTCTSKLIFTSCTCGEPGNTNISSVLQESDLYQHSKEMFPDNQYHLVGSCAYPLKGWLLVPFDEEGPINMEEVEYNNQLFKTYAKIDYAFASVKSRFKRLKYLVQSDTESASDVIMSCCILHNMELGRKGICI